MVATGTFRHQTRNFSQTPNTDPQLCRLEREVVWFVEIDLVGHDGDDSNGRRLLPNP